MFSERNFSQGSPLTWLGGFPVYLATAIAAALAAAMILTSFAQAASVALLNPFIFNWQTAVEGFQVWQFVTYAFVNPPSIFFVAQLFFFAMFGAEVEKYLGRQAFVWLCVSLLIAGPVLMSLLGLTGYSQPLAGSSCITFAVFIAFVLLYPKAEIFFSLQARWLGIALLAILSLQDIAARDIPDLVLLWGSCGTAYAFLRAHGAGFRFSWPQRFKPAPRSKHLRPLKSPSKTSAPKEAEPEEVHESIDPILEKISRSGIGSLSRAERARLERARESLLAKDRPR